MRLIDGGFKPMCTSNNSITDKDIPFFVLKVATITPFTSVTVIAP